MSVNKLSPGLPGPALPAQFSQKENNELSKSRLNTDISLNVLNTTNVAAETPGTRSTSALATAVKFIALASFIGFAGCLLISAKPSMTDPYEVVNECAAQMSKIDVSNDVLQRCKNSLSVDNLEANVFGSHLRETCESFFNLNVENNCHYMTNLTPSCAPIPSPRCAVITQICGGPKGPMRIDGKGFLEDLVKKCSEKWNKHYNI